MSDAGFMVREFRARAVAGAAIVDGLLFVGPTRTWRVYFRIDRKGFRFRFRYLREHERKLRDALFATNENPR